MLRKHYLVPVLAVFLLPAIARAEFQQGNWELTLHGSGASDRDLDNTVFAASGSVAHFLSDQWSAGVRQSVGFSRNGGSDFNAVTRIFTQYHFDMDRWQPFVGASFGYRYGDGVRDEWVGGLEGGVKWFANSTTFIFAGIGYDVETCRSWSDTGFWVYSLGIGFRW